LPVVERDDQKRIVGYLGRADILAARLRAHEEEEVREKGPLSKKISKVPELVR
jgi:CIC family chloride channel protein